MQKEHRAILPWCSLKVKGGNIYLADNAACKIHIGLLRLFKAAHGPVHGWMGKQKRERRKAMHGQAPEPLGLMTSWGQIANITVDISQWLCVKLSRNCRCMA